MIRLSHPYSHKASITVALVLPSHGSWRSITSAAFVALVYHLVEFKYFDYHSCSYQFLHHLVSWKKLLLRQKCHQPTLLSIRSTFCTINSRRRLGCSDVEMSTSPDLWSFLWWILFWHFIIIMTFSYHEILFTNWSSTIHLECHLYSIKRLSEVDKIDRYNR